MHNVSQDLAWRFYSVCISGLLLHCYLSYQNQEAPKPPRIRVCSTVTFPGLCCSLLSNILGKLVCIS